MKFDNSYIKLPKKFYSASSAAIFKKPKLIALNTELAAELGFEYKDFSEQELAEIFSGQKKLLGSEFISMVYAAHQFGHFVPILGDGRAILIGEAIGKNNNRYDIQLKGAGPTAYSRRGDGFSALGPVLREFMLSEFMNTMKIPTTRALAAVATGEFVEREEILPGGVFTRVASSHIRIGTFQYFAGNSDLDNLKILLNYSINRHYPEIYKESNDTREYPKLFLKKVIKAQVNLVSSWMSIGFIHGVMNTDNMSISGETIDYGPCAFMDIFNFEQVYSFIDRNGRYSYINQAQILAWNLARLADSLVVLVEDRMLLDQELNSIKEQFEDAFVEKMSIKLSLNMTSLTREEKKDLISDFLEMLQLKKVDYTSSFRSLSKRLMVADPIGELEEFFFSWSSILKRNGVDFFVASSFMNTINPIYIPRNHLVELAIEEAIDSNYSRFYLMNDLFKNPFVENLTKEIYSHPPKPEEEISNTFCGT